MNISDNRSTKYIKLILSSPESIIIAIVNIVILTVFSQPNLMLTAIARMTVIPIETGCKPSVYAPVSAKTIQIGRASCRERVEKSEGAGPREKKEKYYS